MLSKVLVFSGLLAVVLSVPALEPVAIVSQSADISPDGTFQWGFESADGTKQEESGNVNSVQGLFGWTDPTGGKHEIKYSGGENGYVAVGSDVPAIPVYIARALEWIAAHPSSDRKVL